MFGDRLMILGLSALIACLAVYVSTLPALTEDPSRSDEESEYFRQSQVERNYCRSTLGGVDCKCFADTSMYIMSDEAPRIPGFRYADKLELARVQAEKDCN